MPRWGRVGKGLTASPFASCLQCVLSSRVSSPSQKPVQSVSSEQLRSTQERYPATKGIKMYRKPVAQWDRNALPVPGLSVSQEVRGQGALPSSTVPPLCGTHSKGQTVPAMDGQQSLGWHFFCAGMAAINRGVVRDDTQAVWRHFTLVFPF